MKFDRRGEILVVSPEEQIAFNNSNIIKEEIKKNISKEIHCIVMDMSKVPFLDSSGAGLLISLLKLMNQRNGKVLLSGLNEDVVFVLKISKLDTIFQTYDTLEEALGTQKVL